jgi:hypothetical protein
MERSAIRATVAGALSCIAAASCAFAQYLDSAVSGFAVAPPAGYVAGRGTPSSPSHVVVNLIKPAEPGTVCEVSFEALPGFEQFSQEALNRQTDNPHWDVFYRNGLGKSYVVRGVERFDHQDVHGALVQATSKARPSVRGWAAGLPTLIFMFYTPKGLNKVTCVAGPANFEARRAEFEAVARSVTLAR